MNHKAFLFIFLFAFSFCNAQRLVKTINPGWDFRLEKDSVSEIVNIPHTWNAKDAFEEDRKYYRGKGIYSKEIFIPEAYQEKSVFIHFEGANQLTRVFINGKKAGEHIGGYTGFAFDISDFLKFGKANEFRIEVDNSFNEDIPPLEADFNFYGGIYRDLELIITGKSHFKIEGNAAGNLLIRTPKVSEKVASVYFEGEFIPHSEDKNLSVEVEISDPQGKIVHKEVKTFKYKRTQFSFNFNIENPVLWSPNSPDLYLLKANLKNKKGEIVDSFISNFGCRWFRADPEKGFFLNGKPIKLIGANRHQDFEDLGNALPNFIHRKDYKMIKDMGSNFVRLAHYPQDPEVYRMCDELGLLVWTEVPIINDVTASDTYHQNAVNMQREQILQLYNHPSIVFWGYMNEIFIRLVFNREMTEAEKSAKIETSVELAKKLEAATKALDTSRLTVMALHENELYNTSGIADIPDVIGWNLYFGWYSPGLENFGKFLDKQHQKYPNRPLIISEYGPGSDSRIQTNDPKPWDFSEAYQLKSHLSYINQVMERPYVLGMTAWNFADFGSSGRQDTRPGINQKGLVNFNRKPKDIYYYYKTRFSENDFVYIAGRNFQNRFIHKNDSIELKVFANTENVELNIDRKTSETAAVNDNIAIFKLPLSEGEHRLTAKAGNSEFQRKIKVHFRENLLQNIENNTININAGAHSDFIDEKTGEIWISDQPYTENSFGYIGGKDYRESASKFQGTAANIKNTENDPLFQTMREGIKAYKFNTKPGKYKISLFFTEPNRSASKETLYNLSNESRGSTEDTRIFNISINGRKVERNLNLAAQYGILQAVEIDYEIWSDNGISIEFDPVEGQPVLSGIRLERL
ncbi:glycoside hydrolase family 2 [Christiangramia fulva]|uniref:Glycoside hydrolase family 2 n=1 Tax=Christiangramia fulva TaxID=2126553 RepID=A0A2R3Z5G1_9FLAO|nr:glycoside hydrolase family 2 TIM barrel-domain containing protein [Christiangramia fulva]AVR45517.1 glycoside hydrolase family 2 [Christiangramia fulva]